jgi:hypothetical protein
VKYSDTKERAGPRLSRPDPLDTIRGTRPVLGAHALNGILPGAERRRRRGRANRRLWKLRYLLVHHLPSPIADVDRCHQLSAGRHVLPVVGVDAAALVARRHALGASAAGVRDIDPTWFRVGGYRDAEGQHAVGVGGGDVVE